MGQCSRVKGDKDGGEEAGVRTNQANGREESGLFTEASIWGLGQHSFSPGPVLNAVKGLMISPLITSFYLPGFLTIVTETI